MCYMRVDVFIQAFVGKRSKAVWQPNGTDRERVSRINVEGTGHRSSRVAVTELTSQQSSRQRWRISGAFGNPELYQQNQVLRRLPNPTQRWLLPGLVHNRFPFILHCTSTDFI